MGELPMKRSIYLLAFCVLKLSAIDANSESNINDRELSINFPRGNVLVWVAYFDRAIKEQFTDQKVFVSVDVGLPVIVSKTRVENTQVLDSVRTNIMDRLIVGLQAKEPSYGTGIVHPPLDAHNMPGAQIMKLIGDCFGCYVVCSTNSICFRLYPEKLEICEYRRDTKASRDVWEFLNIAYSGGDEIVAERFFYLPQGPTFERAIIVATPATHERALMRLAEMESKFPCPKIMPFVSSVSVDTPVGK
jgi:hypothetical protein